MTFRQLRFLVLIALCCALANMPRAAEDTKAPAKTSPWKPEDVVFAENVRQFRISPDGQWVAWIKAQGDKEKDGIVSNLVLSSLTSDVEIQLTRGTDAVSAFNWSPDGKWIAFLSSKARPQAKPDTAATQIWLINPHGGEPYALTELAHGPQGVGWMDKETVLFSAEEDPSAYEQAEKKRKDDSEVADDADHAPPVRLFKINVKDKKITRLTNNTDWIKNWVVSKDGKYVAADHAKSLHYTFDQKVPPIVLLHNLVDGTEKQIFTEYRGRSYGFEWTPDSSGFYAWAPYSTDAKFITASILLLYYYDVGTGKSIQVPLDWENGIGSDLAATTDGFVLGLAAGHRFETAKYTRAKSGDSWTWKRTSLEGDMAKNIERFDVTPDSKSIAYEYSTASVMPQLYKAQLDGDKLVSPVQLTHLNENLIKSRAIAKAEVIRWKGANNDEVEGILHYPAKYEAGKKYPLITAIHGGPAGSDKDFWDNNWAYPLQLLTQRGAFVLQVNYHGSNNYGLKWVESICCGKYYDSDWGNVAFGDSFDSYYFGKSPMEDPNLYIHKSPFFKMDKVKAPVLIFHGTADTNVPPAQSWSYFRALQYYGNVPVKFVIFPGEPHGPRKLTHQMRKVEEEMAWFDKYFFKTTPVANEALKAGSPLDAALKTKNTARTGGDFGNSFATKGKPVVIPEVVKRGDMEVGRFEVTRAQFAAFDKNYRVDSGTENYPANGVPFDQAKAYTEWLSKLTGQTWRLPTEKEAAGWYEKKDGENTLDYWAGYVPNPDDTKRLQQKVKELVGNAPLLKPAGSFPGQGQEDQELVFDLGGNVAEWAALPDGKGKGEGGSADCPSDPRSSCAAAAEYIGFRVVRGAAKP